MGGSGIISADMNRVGVFPALGTLANGYCGVLAIYKASDGRPYAAAFLILLAMFFDMLDGKVARMAGVTSRFGAYLDSLSDAISFGVAPAFLAKTVGEGIYPNKVLALLTITFALCALLRLAKYNEEFASPEGADKSGKPVKGFTGMPTPGAAGIIAAMVFLAYDENAMFNYAPTVAYAVPILCLLLGLLMVSRVPYIHFGTRFLQGRRDFGYLFGVVVMVGLLAVFPEECVAVGFVIYGLSGPVLMPFRKPGPTPANAPEDVKIPDGL